MRVTHLLSVALGVESSPPSKGVAAIDPSGQMVLSWHQYSGNPWNLSTSRKFRSPSSHRDLGVTP